MPHPAPPPAPQTAQLRTAFTAMHWVGWTFEAALADPVRRDIITHIASHWHRRPMENIVSVSRIEQLAQRAALHAHSARHVNPYPEHSAAGGLFTRCFDAEQKRLKSHATPAQAATETIATRKDMNA